MKLRIYIPLVAFAVLILTIKGTTTESKIQKVDVEANDIQIQVYETAEHLVEEQDTSFYEDIVIEEKVEVSSSAQVNISAQLSRYGRSAYEKREIELLARIIQAEALGEPLEGQFAVGGVVLNRVKSPKFPNTIRDVIYEDGQFCGVDSKLFHQEIDPDIYEVSRLILEQGIDKSGGSLFFLNKNVSKMGHLFDERYDFVVRIGDHWFYKLKGE